MTDSSPAGVSKTYRVLTVITFTVIGIALLPALIAIVVIWLPGDLPRNIYAEDIAVHRIHVIAISIASWILFASVGTQLRKPQLKSATMILALAAMVTFVIFDPISGVFIPLEILVLALLIAMYWFHPQRGQLPWRPLHRITTAMVAIGSIPWLIYGWDQMQAQLAGSAVDRHVELGHYGSTAAMVLIVVTAAVIGSTALPGWRAAIYLGSAGAVVFGTTSIILPNSASSGGLEGGAAVITWAAVLLAATSARSRTVIDDPTDRTRGEASTKTPPPRAMG